MRIARLHMARPGLCSIARTIDVRFEVPPPPNKNPPSVSEESQEFNGRLGRCKTHDARADPCAYCSENPFFRQPFLFETDAAGLFDPAAKTASPAKADK